MSAQDVTRARKTIQTLLKTEPNPSTDLRVENCGYIKSFTTSTATITVQGVDIEIPRAKRSNPAIGEEAIVVKNGTDWWLLDTFAL